VAGVFQSTQIPPGALLVSAAVFSSAGATSSDQPPSTNHHSDVAPRQSESIDWRFIALVDWVPFLRPWSASASPAYGPPDNYQILRGLQSLSLP